MKARLAVAIFAILLSPLAFAQVSGIVKLDGKPPEMKVIDMSGVQNCAQQHDKPLHEETVVVASDGGLANVIVSIKRDEGQALPGDNAPSKQAVVLDQKGCQYIPHVVAAQIGQPIVVKNSDSFMHNVHALAQNNAEENIGEPLKDSVGQKLKKTTAEEYFPLMCNVHPWMRAWIGVIDNKFFAVTDKDGKFKLPDGLPNGNYTLHAWHEKYGEQDQKIIVKDGKATGDFIYKP